MHDAEYIYQHRGEGRPLTATSSHLHVCGTKSACFVIYVLGIDRILLTPIDYFDLLHDIVWNVLDYFWDVSILAQL